MKESFKAIKKSYKASRYTRINPISFDDLNSENLSILLREANEGNVRAQILLAISFADERFQEVDYKKSAFWFRLAALQGDVFAQFQLACCYMDGKGVSRNLKNAASWIRRVACFGNVEAQCLEADLYSKKYGMEESYSLFFEDFEYSAINDYVPAINKLACCYLLGLGTSVNEERAAQLFLSSANSGHIEGQWNIYRCYGRGIGVPYDEEKALYWLQRYMENNRLASQNKFFIEKVLLNIKSEVKEKPDCWMMVSLQDNFRLYCMNVAMSHLIGRAGYEKNITLAHHWFAKSALEIPVQLEAVDDEIAIVASPVLQQAREVERRC